MRVVVALALGVVLIAGAWTVVSRRRSAFVLGVVVATNASAVLHDEVGVPAFILPMSLAVIGMGVFRAIRGATRDPAGPATTGGTPDWLVPAVGAAIAGVVMSAAMGPFVSRAAETSTAAVGRLTEHLLVVGAAAVVAAHRRGLQALLWGLLTGGLALSLVTIVQAVTSTQESTALGFGSWNQEVLGGLGDSLRAAGPFGDDPNAYAQYLVVLLGIALGMAVTAPRRSGLRSVAVAACVTTTTAILFTASRTGLIGIVVLGVALPLIRGVRRRQLVALAIGGLVLLVGPFGAGERLASLGTSPTAETADSGLRGRASEMIAAVDMFADHPVFGVGYGSYNDRYLDYSRSYGIDPRFEQRSAHSLPLEVAAEQGIVGLIAWGALAALIAVVAVRLRRRWPDCGTAYGLGVLGFATTSIFLHDVHPRLMWTLVGAAFGGAIALRRRHRRDLELADGAPLRVAMVIQSYVPAVGGAERQLANLMPGFAARGIDAIVVTRHMAGRPRDDVVDGVRVLRLAVAGPKALRSMMFVAQARAALARFDPDVVHAFDTMTPTSIALGHRAEVGTPSVTKILRSGELGDLHRLAVKPFGILRLRRVLGHSDALVAISDDIEIELRGLGVDDDRIAGIPNGVDTDRFRPPHRPVRPAAADGFNVIATGRLAPEKRLVELASRWERVRDRWPGARLLLVGDGPEAERLEGRPGVELLGRRSDVPDLLRDADVYVSASAAEGLSNSLLEAMASGLPCVVTDVGGVRDVITQPTQGEPVDASDLDGLVDRLIEIIDDQPRRGVMRREARRRVMQSYSLESTADELSALYRRLADTDRPTEDERRSPVAGDAAESLTT